MFPKWTVITIHLIIAFTVNTLERTGTRFPFLCFKPWRICLKVGFATPYYFSIIVKFVQSISFLTLWSICAIYKHSMPPLPAVFVLRNTRVYICSSDHNNMLFYIQIPVNKAFCICIILWILNVDSYYGHIRFGRYLDNSRMRG